MRIWIAVVVCASSIGCSEASLHARDVSQASREASQLVYFKDPRTELCFAGKYLWSSGAVLTSVPCSQAVEQVISEQIAAQQATVP
jgi:hypothetical protein